MEFSSLSYGTPKPRSYVLSFLSLQRLSRKVFMEDYLLKNKGVFLVAAFKATSWDNTFEKDHGDCPGAEVLMFPKNAKLIFSKDKSTLCYFLRRILRIVLKRDGSTHSLNEPGFGIISMEPLQEKSPESSPDQYHVEVKKALRGLCKAPSPSRLLRKAVANLEGYRSNLKGQLMCLDLNIPHYKEEIRKLRKVDVFMFMM
ncbi:hypothetical protein SESBI_19686 [Sesbania bispinosa]|nr:hypothetical protein SESBI_19686 [Sesbania bispinosa]